MRLAALVGLNVAPVRLTTSAQKDVLLIERFDRTHGAKGWQRRAFVSALTLFGLDEMMARYASYADLAEIIRHRFVNAGDTLRELYGRLVFNILRGNTDDHARNHGTFWDGESLELTPAYDICPQTRAGQDHLSRVSSCLEAAAHFHMSREEALGLVGQQLTCIIENWDNVCDEAGLSQVDRAYLWGRQFLNPFAFDDLSGDAAHLTTMADEARV